MKVFLTTEERKKLLKRGLRHANFIQVSKIMDSMGIDRDTLVSNDRLKFILNSEIKKRLKVLYEKGSENVVYQVLDINPDLVYNIQIFFDAENLGVNLMLVDYSGKWCEHHDLFLTVISS